MRFKVIVTQDHIDRGEIEDARCCPIALALNDMGWMEAAVHHDCIDLDSDDDGLPLVYLPATASAFVTKFDEGEPVTPFSFEASFPEECAVVTLEEPQ